MTALPSRYKASAGALLAGLVAVMSLTASGEARAPEGGTCLPVAVVTEAKAVAKTPTPPPRAREPLDRAQRALVEHLSRRYRVAREAVSTIVAEAYRAGESVGLDPLLLLAVISVESSFNPVAESVMGAKGLMQIIPRFHLAKLEAHGGEAAVLDPVSNIHVGARILQEYVYRMGTLEGGLQFYNGARSDPTAQYAGRVMGERARLERALAHALHQQPLHTEGDASGRDA